MKNKKILNLILVCSLFFNGLVVYLDVFPTIYPKVQAKYFSPKTLANERVELIEEKLYQAGLAMLLSEKPLTIFQEPKGFTNALLQRRSVTSSNEFQFNNYPRSFLFLGLLSYAEKYKTSDLLTLKNYFDRKFIELNTEISRIDQAPLGSVALRLFKLYGEDKYQLFAERVYDSIVYLIDENGLLSYREEYESMLNDALGLAIPFLVDYASYHDGVLGLAHEQLSFYIANGIDSTSYLPSHAVNKKTKEPLNNVAEGANTRQKRTKKRSLHIVNEHFEYVFNAVVATQVVIQRLPKTKVGSSNWGRGIGWYVLGLSSYHQVNKEFEAEYNGIMNTLEKLKIEGGFWSQFPGSSNSFDASSTLLFLYSRAINDGSLDRRSFISAFAEYISEEGEVLYTSGDTYSSNYYSSSFGKSELSQGLMLLLLSEL